MTIVDDVYLYEGNLGEILRRGKLVKLNVRGKWSKKHEALCRQFGVDTLLLADSHKWKDSNLAFLPDQTFVKSVTISAYRVINCAALSRCQQLKELRLLPYVTDTWGAIAFEEMKSLRSIDMEWRKEWSNVLFNLNLMSFEARGIRRMKSLDFSKLNKLKKLAVSSRGLREIQTGAAQRLKEFRVSLCPALKVDLNSPAFSSLRTFWVVGKCDWWTDALLTWKSLRTLYLSVRTAPDEPYTSKVKAALQRLNVKIIL